MSLFDYFNTSNLTCFFDSQNSINEIEFNVAA